MEFTKRFIGFGFTFALGALALGCAPYGGEDYPGRLSHNSIQGSLLQKVDELRFAPYRDARCDLLWEPRLLEMAAALDEKRDLIRVFLESKPVQSSSGRVTVGPAVLRDIGRPPVAKSEWLAVIDGWSEMHDFYLKIKSTSELADWARLDRGFRAHLMDDQARRLWSWRVFYTMNSGSVLQSISAAIDACAAKADCKSPEFDAKAQELIQLNPAYRAAAAKDSKSSLKELVEDDYYSLFAFRKTGAVKRASKNVFKLMLDPGVFAGAEGTVARFIEETWRSDRYRVEIEWLRNDPTPFKLLYDGNTMGRASVFYKARTMNFFFETTNRSIAHEAGHILGFKDQYYTRWNPEFCDYTIQYNPGDIMSDSSTGSVLPEMWQELDLNYPL